MSYFDLNKLQDHDVSKRIILWQHTPYMGTYYPLIAGHSGPGFRVGSCLFYSLFISISFVNFYNTRAFLVLNETYRICRSAFWSEHWEDIYIYIVFFYLSGKRRYRQIIQYDI